jgi:hypothetical protein
MHTNDHDKIDPSELAKMGYETRDLNIKQILGVGAGFIIFTLFGVLLSYWFFLIPGIVPKQSASARPVTRLSPPPGTPILNNNTNNTDDIATLRQKEQAILTTAGPAADAGFYHIPIDQAMQLVLKRGLPSSAPDANVPPGQTAPMTATGKQAAPVGTMPAQMGTTGGPGVSGAPAMGAPAMGAPSAATPATSAPATGAPIAPNHAVTVPPSGNAEPKGAAKS